MQADYVIVGAGSAGCVLANRLTEDPATRVILIEAGGRDWNPLIHIPVGYMKLLDHKQLTRGFKAEAKQYIADEAINAMKKAVTDQGLSVDEYNTIVQTAQNDPTVRQKLVQRIHPSGQ